VQLDEANVGVPSWTVMPALLCFDIPYC